MSNERLYQAQELVASVRPFFVKGVAKDKNGNNIYLTRIFLEDGKTYDFNRTKLMITLYLAGDDATAPKFINFACTLQRCKKFKEQGVDLALKSKTPVKVKYSIQEYTKDNSTHLIREIINISIKNPKGEWQDLIVNSPVNEEDTNEGLPF